MIPPTSDTSPRPAALVTGAAIRIGAVIARTLHDAGYDLALHCHHSGAAMRALCAELDATRAGSTLMLQGDLADAACLAELVPAAVEHFGRLDALVNNASAYRLIPLQDATTTQWDDAFHVNARAPFFLAQAAAPQLLRTHGAIVNLTDYYAEHPQADGIVHAASKAALAAATKGLARALGPQVRCNAVSPGAILWPENGKPDADRQAILDATALARTGTPEDIADTVLWLLRDAKFVTGQVIRVDGGRSA